MKNENKKQKLKGWMQNMKTILNQIRQYKKATILTPIFTALEVIMEVLLPFITAMIIDKGLQQENMEQLCCLWQCAVYFLAQWQENMRQVLLQVWLVI